VRPLSLVNMPIWVQKTLITKDFFGNTVKVSRPLPGQMLLVVVSANGNVRASLDFEPDTLLWFFEEASRELTQAAREIE
jgi:hypothetical protein